MLSDAFVLKRSCSPETIKKSGTIRRRRSSSCASMAGADQAKLATRQPLAT
jgi:hypothetical protein